MAQATIAPLPPAEAIAALQRRGQRLDPTFSWQDAWQAEHAQMFTVAKSAGFDILKDVHDALIQALAEGRTFQDFARDLKPALEAKGWWGRKEVADPATGEVREVQLGSTRRLRTIFDTNLRVSYAVGHWAQFERNRAARPILRYVAVLDGRVRPAHALRHNVALPIDDPFWDTWAPPCGWGCRCTLQSLSIRDFNRMRGELKTAPPPDTFQSYTNKRTGEVVRVPDGIDPGWGYNPGKAGFRAVAVPEGEAEVIRALAADRKGGGAGGVAPVVPPALPQDVQPPPGSDPAPRADPTVDHITEARDWHRVSFRTDDADLSGMIAAAPQAERIAPIPGRSAYAKGVQIHMDGYETRADTARARATWRHEYGHHLDTAAGDRRTGRSASSAPAATRAMRRDLDAMRAGLSDSRHATAAEALRGLSEGQIDEALRIAGVDLTSAELRTIAQPSRVPDVAGALIAGDARAYLNATRGAAANDAAAVALNFTSDFFEAVSQATIGGLAAQLYGHGAGYYRQFDALGDGYTEGHGSEAFANYITLRGSPDTLAHYRAIRHLAPSTTGAFDAIVRAFPRS